MRNQGQNKINIKKKEKTETKIEKTK